MTGPMQTLMHIGRCGLFIGVWLFIASAASLAGEWAIQREDSTLGFAVDVQGQAITGHFTKFETRIDFDATVPANGWIEAVIDLTSLTMGSTQADTMAKSAEWLAAADFTTATFQSTSIKKAGPNRFVAKGTVSLKGVTLSVTLEFDLETAGDTARATGSTTLTRVDFGVGAATSAANPVGETVKVMFDIAATAIK